MTVGTKMVVAAIGALCVSMVVGLVVQWSVIRQQGIDLTQNTMRATLLEAENVRQSVSSMAVLGAFDYPKMITAAKGASDMRETALYKSVPVVSAWRAIEKVAEQEGYEFRIPKMQPRNPKNLPTEQETKILEQFKTGGLSEYFEVNEQHNQIL